MSAQKKKNFIIYSISLIKGIQANAERRCGDG